MIKNSNIPTIYFAHPVTTYNTVLEKMVIDTLNKQGRHILVNPNGAEHAEKYRERGMDYFLDLIDDCDAVYSLHFSDHSIGAGIAKEIQCALDNNKTVINLVPHFTYEEIFKETFPQSYKVLTVEETREKIKNNEI